MWYKGYDNLITQRERTKEKNRCANIFIVSFALLLVLLIVLRFVVFTTVYVDGTSMENTVFDGDLLLVNKLDKPERGDIVIFERADIDADGNIHYHYDSEGNKIRYIKRVIAKPNESVYWVDGQVYLSFEDSIGYHDVKLYEPYAKNGTYSGIKSDKPKEEAVIVPENHYFVLGDNRKVSVDSRAIGCIDERLIVGVVDDFFVERRNNKFWKFVIWFL